MVEIEGSRIQLDNGYEIREYASIYGHIRGLIYNNSIQSLMYIHEANKYKLPHRQLYLYDLPNDINPKGKDYLVLGGGALSYPRYYISHYKEKNMDVVELNKQVIDINKEYFYLDELINEFDSNHERLNIIVDDAIKYIDKCNKKYDYILIDIFDGDNPLPSIYSNESINNIKRIINEDSIVLINYIINDTSIKQLDLLRKMINSFNYNKIISIDTLNNLLTKSGNIVVVLSDKKFKIPNIPNKYIYEEISIDNI